MLIFPDTLSGNFFCAVKRAEKCRKTGAAGKISSCEAYFCGAKLLRTKINRIFVR
jgi:hypothetical protein